MEKEIPSPTIEPIKNGWHALSRELNLAVRGESEQDARERFREAAQKAAEIRARPEPGVETSHERGES